jgi:hypothetical protein
MFVSFFLGTNLVVKIKKTQQSTPIMLKGITEDKETYFYYLSLPPSQRKLSHIPPTRPTESHARDLIWQWVSYLEPFHTGISETENANFSTTIAKRCEAN